MAKLPLWGHSASLRHRAKLQDTLKSLRGGQERLGADKVSVRHAAMLKTVLTVRLTAYFRGKWRMDRLGLASGLEAPLHLPGFGSSFVFTFSGGFQRQAESFGQRSPVLAQQAVILCQEPATAPTGFRFPPRAVGKLEGCLQLVLLCEGEGSV